MEIHCGIFEVAVFNRLSISCHLSPSILYPLKYQKTSGFLVFVGVIERDHWHEIGSVVYIMADLVVLTILRSFTAARQA